jgi:hypothetical protein
MIAFGFGRAVNLDAGMPAGFRHQSRAVCRSRSKLSRASDDCAIAAAKPNPKIAAILTFPPCVAGMGENN